MEDNRRMDPNTAMKDTRQAESENVVGQINALIESSLSRNRRRSRKGLSKRKKTTGGNSVHQGELSNNDTSALDFSNSGDGLSQRRSIKSRSSRASKNRGIDGEHESINSITSSIRTESIYTHSFHGRFEAPQLHGPPPLKRTFLDNSSGSDSGNIHDASADSYVRNAYRKPDWKFPVKRILRNDDDQLYETLRERYSVKNIVSQLKRST